MKIILTADEIKTCVIRHLQTVHFPMDSLPNEVFEAIEFNHEAVTLEIDVGAYVRDEQALAYERFLRRK